MVTAAAWPRGRPEEERLLHVDPLRGTLRDRRVGELGDLLRPGDLVVVNDAATLPASLPGRTWGGAPVEVRLAGANADGTWTAVLFGDGDWRTRTEDRPAPPELALGQPVVFGGGVLSAVVTAVSRVSPRLVDLGFSTDGDRLWSALYRLGRPVQYSYLRDDLGLGHVQTPYATRPWAMEPPSAGRPLTAALLLDLRRRGVGVATLTHAAGLSSTGDAAVDALLPLPERYEVPRATVEAVAAARAGKGRVLAVGTTVVRALESAAETGTLRAGAGRATLRVTGTHRPRVAHGVFTGVHGPGESHFALLTAFAPEDLLRRAWAHAGKAGYLNHEFGDSQLVLA
jgi:S-adenosylmethionine:tRNA ribosyltransferase-isomerase